MFHPFVFLFELTYTSLVMGLVTVIAFAIVSLAIFFPTVTGGIFIMTILSPNTTEV